MKRAVLWALAIIVFASFVGAYYVSSTPSRPVATKALGVGDNIRVEKLFTNNGCVMYRFYDANAYRYYRDCSKKCPAGEVLGKDE